MSVNVIPVVNPHQKMEGIQNIRPKEIEKLLDKAKNLPIKQEGDFVKLQNYEFHVDEFEEMDDPKGKKDNKKQNKKGNKKEEISDEKEQAKIDESQVSQVKNNIKQKALTKPAPQKAQGKQVPPKKGKEKSEKAEEAEEEIEENQEAKDNEDNNVEQVDQEVEDQEQECEVDQNDMKQQLEEYENQNEEQEEIQEQDGYIEQSDVQQSKQSKSIKQKKFQSDYAAMMDDLLNESGVSAEEQQQPKNTEDQPVLEKSQLGVDAKQEQDYLKIIKQYQVKIKKLNEELEQRNQPVLSQIQEDQLEELQEQLDKTEESISNKKHLYPGLAGIGISLYDEFRLPQIVEEQVQFRLKELGIEDKQREENQQKLLELEEQHQRELDEIKQNYELKLKQLQDELELQQQLKQSQRFSERAESDISRVLTKMEIQQLKQDPQFSIISSNLVQSVDSNVSEVLKDETLYLKYRAIMEKAKEKQSAEEKCLEIINSKIYDMITPEEAKEFMKYETDSNISIENIMGVEKALRLVQPHQVDNSNIDSMISPEEQEQFKRDPKFLEQTLPNSSIEFSIDDNEKLRRMIDSDISNFQMKIDEEGSLFQELQQELEQQYPITDSNRLIMYQQIAENQKQEFEKQLKKVQKKKNPSKKQYLQKEPSNSSIGSLANKSIPQNISSSISQISGIEKSSSIIGSLISVQEKQELLQKSSMNNESSIGSIITSQVKSEDFQKVSSNISELNSLVSESISQKQSVSSGISKILNEKQSSRSKYSVDSSLNISQGNSSVKSYLLLKQQMLQKKY